MREKKKKRVSSGASIVAEDMGGYDLESNRKKEKGKTKKAKKTQARERASNDPDDTVTKARVKHIKPQSLEDTVQNLRWRTKNPPKRKEK